MNNEDWSPHVSVIIPVFRPGSAITECVNSLRKQSLKDVEFIFVDDCGNDGSMSIVYEAAEIDNRIIVINNNENMGPGASRNKGIEIARGEYISFVDSDDKIAENFLELLYRKAINNNADIACGKVVCIDKNGKIDQSYDDQWRIDSIKTGLESGKPLYSIFNSHHVSAIYANNLIAHSNSRYGEWVMGEDLIFLIKVTNNAKNLEIEEKAIYYYRQTDNSLCRKFTDRIMRHDYLSFKELLEYMNENIEFDTHAANYVCSRIHNLLRNIALSNVTIGMKNASEEVLHYLITEIRSSHLMDVIDECSMEVKTLALYGYNLIYIPISGLDKDTTFHLYFDAIERTMEFARNNQNHKNIYRYFGMNSIRDTIKFINSVNMTNTLIAKTYLKKINRFFWSPRIWLENGMKVQSQFLYYYYKVIREDY